MRHSKSALIALGMLLGGCSSQLPTRTATVVPLRSVRLYETGVGYFERSGPVMPGGATLPVPAGHLDDALKSLVVLTPGEAVTLEGISFPSSLSATMARSRVGIPTENAPITYRILLTSLKGEPIELSAGSKRVRGRIIDVVDEETREFVGKAAGAAEETKEESVDQKENQQPGDSARPTAVKVAWVLTLGEGGEITRTRLDEVVRVQPLDGAVAARLSVALDALSPRSAQIAKSMRLLGTSRGPVTFGYIAESPVWRTTYRLVLRSSQPSGVLQGWALVHNDTEEDWRDVKLELVNGRPDSFLHPLSAPRYFHRTVVGPDSDLSTVPQLQDRTVDGMWGDGTVSRSSEYGSGAGYGSGSGSLGGSHRTASPHVRMGATTVSGTSTGTSGLLEVGNLAGLAPATGVESGALFLYCPSTPFSLAPHSSALVPILEKEIRAEPIVWFSSPSASARTALRMFNGTGQTLASGVLAVFADGGFQGEAMLDRLKPGERRFVELGDDMDIVLKEEVREVKDESRRVTFNGGTLMEHFLRTTDRAYEFENRSERPRSVYVPLSTTNNAKVTGADELDYEPSVHNPIVVFKVGPRVKVKRAFQVVEGLSRNTTGRSLTQELLRGLGRNVGLPRSEQTILAEAADQMKEAEGKDSAARAAEREAEEAEADLERVRGHLNALGAKANGDGANPFVRRILETEDKLSSARKRKDLLEKEALSIREKAIDVLKKLVSKVE